MATGSLILGKLKGSIGDVTAQSRGDKQVSRRRVREVANPKTDAQTLNRVIIGTVGAAYARMLEICDHSFQGLTSKSANMQEFLRVNQNALRSNLVSGGSSLAIGNFLAISQVGLVPNQYIVSKGTLPIIPTSFTSTSGGEFPLWMIPVRTSNAPTYQDICDWFSLKRGDQLTFVWIEGDEFPNTSSPEALFGQNNLFQYSRIILDPMDANTGAQAPMTTPLFGESGEVSLPSKRNSGTPIRITAQGQTSLTFFPEFNNFWDNRVCLAFGIIVSRYNGNTWQRSFCRLSMPLACLNIPTMQQAIEASYPDSSDLLDPTKFLNASPKN